MKVDTVHVEEMYEITNFGRIKPTGGWISKAHHHTFHFVLAYCNEFFF